MLHGEHGGAIRTRGYVEYGGSHGASQIAGFGTKGCRLADRREVGHNRASDGDTVRSCLIRLGVDKARSRWHLPRNER